MMEPVREALQKIIADMIRQCPPEQAPIVAWQFVCGKAVADRTEALSFTDGVLSIRVADAAWKSHLADMTPHYLEMLRKYTGQRIERLSFVSPAHIDGKRSST
jgi:predicted nucleic acid-binding Zn ribbon protein